MREVMTYGCSLAETLSSKALNTVPKPEEWGSPMLIIRKGQQLYALEVDRLITEQELVIKPFGSVIAAPAYCYGCTILGDGTLIPVINGASLVEQNLDTTSPEVRVPRSPEPEIPNDTAISTILVVDDSAALRRTLALTLQKAGYRVLQAKDGREALEQLQQSSGIQLVICDVEMPNMNGFEFLGQRRRDPNWLKIPVAMLTSRSSDKHRQLATQLGANAYFTKPYIEQQFLAAVHELLTHHLVSVMT
jgi:chemotaxis family two-component system sensor histidine kinase/response regulator PixL